MQSLENTSETLGIMMKFSQLGGFLLLAIHVVGCSTAPVEPNLTQAQAEANRQYIDQIDTGDRNRTHVERMREVEAIERINSSSKLTVIVK